jgi:hypothetical protein
MNPQHVERARRRRMRGAAMVEGVVVIPFFILMLAGAMFVNGFYGRRIEAQGAARDEAWRRAVSESCDSGANSVLPGLEIIDTGDLGELSKAPLAALCEEDFGSLKYTARSSYAVTGAFNFQKDVAATVTSLCNESPIPGDTAYAAAVEFLWDAYQHQGDLPPNASAPSKLDWGALFSADPSL